MTEGGDETSRSRARFPLVLTLAAAVVFAICCGLGMWQLQRAGWKTQELSRIDALRHAPPVPIGPVLARAASGVDVSFTRVAADCRSGSTASGYMLGAVEGGWAARAIGLCRLNAPPYDSIAMERGVLDSSKGSTSVPNTILPAPQRAVGILLPPGHKLLADTGRTARFILSVESEDPPVSGVTPNQIAASAPDNLQYVGIYAPTWFGLAGAVACVYAAMLWRRHHPKPPQRP
jgi:surfeit locus 1 family protein